MLGDDLSNFLEQEQNNNGKILQNKPYEQEGMLSDLDQRFIDSVNGNQLEQAQTLLNLGANIYARDFYDNPALFIAIRHCNLEMIDLLSQYSDVNDPRNTKRSITPLMEAILWGKIKAIEALLLVNADIHVTDSDGKTAIVYALESDKYDIVDLLEKNGAKLSLLEQRLKDIHDSKKAPKIELSDEVENAINLTMRRVETLAFKKGTFSITPEEEKELNILLGNRKTNPVLAKKKLSWETIARATSVESRDAYLANFTKVNYPIGKGFCELYDLSEADNYRFIVNGFTCNTKNLQELINGERRIIETSCYISASLIDKKTPVCNSVGWPPIHLALVVHPDSIVATNECDIKSPLGQNNEQQKGGYLIEELSKRAGMELRKAAYHAKMFDITQEIPSSFELNAALEQDQAYRRPCDHSASIPLASPDELLRRTQLYNELIIMGNSLNASNQKIKGTLLLLEKSEVDKYSGNFENSTVELLNTLEEKTGGRIKLALIDTNWKRKFSLSGDIKRINSKIYHVNAQLRKLADTPYEDVDSKEKEKKTNSTNPTLSLFELQKKLIKFKKKEKALLELTEDVNRSFNMK